MVAFESRIHSMGLELLQKAQAEEKSLRKKHFLEFALLDWCMKSDELRNRVFRFIDVFPSLKTPDQVYCHLHEYFPQSEHRLPRAVKNALLLTKPHLLTKHLLFYTSRKVYKQVAGMFIGAADLPELARRRAEMSTRGCRLSVDLLGEKTTHEAEADIYEKRYLELIHQLSRDGGDFEELNISVKLSALDPHFEVLDAAGVSVRVRKRLRRIVREAAKRRVFVHIDMEDFSVRDLTLEIIRDLLQEEEFKGGVHLGLVLQAYLQDADSCLDGILGWARGLAQPLTIRLVRGAYWDSEVMQAQAKHWPVPVFTEKAACDAMFEHLTRRILQEAPQIRLAVATHNVRSIAYAMALAEEMKIPKSGLEFQLLYGMGASLMEAVREQGYTPRIYMPIGDPVIGMAYLVRRLLENVSSQSFVRQGIHKPEAAGEVLRVPEPSGREDARFAGRNEWGAHALIRWHESAERLRASEALVHFRERLPVELTPVVSGRKGKGTETVFYAPGDNTLETARVILADEKTAREALATAGHAFAYWRQVSVKRRAECLRRAAEWMMKHRFELMACQMLEAGKTWSEADADVVEAADFLRFYAHHAEILFQSVNTDDLYQERNQSFVTARGICVVIAPWNFPMAILTGMTAAALVTGNTVIMKPAEQTGISAQYVFKALLAGGIPEDVLAFLPGDGAVAGPLLVRHPDTAVIAFTGSRETGLLIAEEAARRSSGQKHLKKVIVEMGGKNAAIVDASADLDEAIPAILYSAFGFSGQKCSALSRLIVMDEVYDTLLKRLAAAAQIYVPGLPELSETLCGPLIDADAVAKFEGYRQLAREEGRVIYEARVASHLQGHYVPPMIVADVPQGSRLLKEEIFGPLLCVLRASDMMEALALANQSEFALTGGLFSRTPSHIELVKQQLQAGNLYINRAITGAVVGRQPFGGFKMSGGGTKAGGAQYLREFVYERVISENVSRHGFAPMDE